MKTIILHVLCEGQTEGDFCNKVLKPYLQKENIVLKHQCLLTNKKLKLSGGMLSFQQVQRDLNLMFKQFADSEYDEHWFTTMFDLYALPSDFPGMDAAIMDKYSKVHHIEDSIYSSFANQRLIPYVELHEFEALVFASVEHLTKLYPDVKTKLKDLIDIVERYNRNPELINTQRETSPSHRIGYFLTQNHHNYNKPLVGVTTTKAEGIDSLRSKCKHFDEWLMKLIAIKQC